MSQLITNTAATPGTLGTPGIVRTQGPTLRDMGAKCDGSDDGPAINAALLAGGVYKATPGTYTIKTPLLTQSHAGIYAERPDDVIFQASGLSNLFYSTGGLSHFRMEGITVDGGGTSRLIAFSGTHNDVHIEGCRFTNSNGGTPLWWPIAIGQLGTGNQSMRVFFRDNEIDTCQPFHECVILINCRDGGCDRNNVHDLTTPSATGLVIYGGGENFSFNGNNFADIQGLDYYLQECWGMTGAGNHSRRSQAGVCFTLINCHNMDLHHTAIDTAGTSIGFQISDFGGIGFEGQGNTHVFPTFPGSRNIRITGTFDGFLIPYKIVGQPVPDSQYDSGSSVMDGITVDATFDGIQGGSAQIGNASAQDIANVKIRGRYSGTYSGTTGAIYIAGNAGLGGSTTTLAQSASVATDGSGKRIAASLVLSGALTNLAVGQWLTIGAEGANTAEDVQVRTMADSTHITAIINGPHGAGATVGLSGTVVGKGIRALRLEDCVVEPSAGGGNTNAVVIDTATDVSITGGSLQGTGAGSGVALANSGKYTLLRNVQNVTPLGALTAPTFGDGTGGTIASNSPWVNPFGVDLMVHLHGGTVTNVGASNAAGSNFGQVASSTPCSFELKAGQSLAVTFSVAPTCAVTGL